ncbi:unnamed protein product [Fraxinus pennsylvanica]|uniref:F-box domain-containing protein n=1 Tax=Fraxinus pennsylvanica TaxID=56036 RepID=A0AAD2DP15_9LAMI|nr:unnamed protein product [Fraxinus pennsylvanica]
MSTRGDEEPHIDQLPIELLIHIFTRLTSFKDLAQASSVCGKWRQGVKESLGRREILRFAGWKINDDSVTRMVLLADGLKELDISRSQRGCQVTDHGLCRLSTAKCICNLSSVSLWGSTVITDKGVVQMISKATSLQHLNLGGTFITDLSMFAIANSCPHLETIVLWGCRRITENGLVALVKKCHKLESINVLGMRVPLDCFNRLLTINPALKIQPEGMLLDDERVHIWSIF